MLTPVSLSSSDFDAAAMTQRIQAVEQHIAQLDNADTWRQYLLLDHIRAMESQQWSACAARAQSSGPRHPDTVERGQRDA